MVPDRLSAALPLGNTFRDFPRPQCLSRQSTETFHYTSGRVRWRQRDDPSVFTTTTFAAPQFVPGKNRKSPTTRDSCRDNGHIARPDLPQGRLPHRSVPEWRAAHHHRADRSRWPTGIIGGVRVRAGLRLGRLSTRSGVDGAHHPPYRSRPAAAQTHGGDQLARRTHQHRSHRHRDSRRGPGPTRLRRAAHLWRALRHPPTIPT